MAEIGPIESGIPIPPKKGLFQPQDKLRLSALAIGDSRFVKGMTQQMVASKGAGAAKRYGMKFTTREMDGGVRIWRVK